MKTTIIAGTLILAFLEDPRGTIQLLTIVLGIGGTTLIIKKITREINQGASEIIEFAGYSAAGISAVKILGKALASMHNVYKFLDWITPFS